MKYRPEIDGLRALAVIPVVIFHLAPHLLPGGFIGVDIFFVISGFLITNIIKEEINQGTFSCKNFWYRRIKRLFPAISVLLLVCLLVGFFVFHKKEFVSLGSQSLYTLLLSANIKMYLTSGYWSTSAEDLPLLHCWSLGVEEQFYIFFVLFIVPLIKHLPQHTTKLLYIIAFSSFSLAIYCSIEQQNFGFYFLPTRAWELLSGSLLAIHQQNIKAFSRKINNISNLSILGILASFFYINPQNQSPEYILALPIFFTLLFIQYSTHGDSICKTIISHPVMIFIGKISYSLYLWHWPVITFYKHIIFPKAANLFDICVMALLSLIFAVISYYYVETPFRNNIYPKAKLIFIYCFSILCLTSFAITKNILPPLNNNHFTTTKKRYPDNFQHPYAISGPYIRGPVKERPDILVLGSSHAQMYYCTVDDIAQELNLNVAYYGFKGRTGRFHYPDEKQHKLNKDFNTIRRNNIKETKPRIILFCEYYSSEYRSSPNSFSQKYQLFFSELLNYTDYIITIEQAPSPGEYKNLEKYLNKAISFSTPIIHEPDPERSFRLNANQEIYKISQKNNRIKYIKSQDLFLDGQSVKYSNDEGFLFYLDNHHLSPHGTDIIKPRIQKTVYQLLKEHPPK